MRRLWKGPGRFVVKGSPKTANDKKPIRAKYRRVVSPEIRRPFYLFPFEIDEVTDELGIFGLET